MSLSNGYYTDALWRVTSHSLETLTWRSLSFTTNGCSNPTVIGRNADMPNGWSEQGGFDADDRRLWSDQDTRGDTNQFRGTVDEP